LKRKAQYVINRKKYLMKRAVGRKQLKKERAARVDMKTK
jgi:hypothetical protein